MPATITARFYPSAVAQMFNNNIDSGDTFKMALFYDTNGSPNGSYNAAHIQLSELGPQITGTGYTSGGATLAGGVTATSDGTKTNISMGSATWNSATFTFRRAAVYSTAGSLNRLIMHLEWDEDQIVMGQDYIVKNPVPSTATPLA